MKRLTKAQRAGMIDVIARYNRDEPIDAPNILDKFLDWPIWSAGENMSGYLPDSPYCLFLTKRAARGYCRYLKRSAGGGDYVQDYMPTTLREILA